MLRDYLESSYLGKKSLETIIAFIAQKNMSLQICRYLNSSPINRFTRIND